MAGGLNRNITVRLLADTSNFTAGMAKVSGESQKTATTMEAARIFLVDTWFSPFSNMAFATVGSVKALISSGTVCIRLAGSNRMAQVST